MKYYFVEEDGLRIDEEENYRGYFTKETNPDMFTTRIAAVKDAKKQLKRKMKEMLEQLKSYENELTNSKKRGK